MLTAGALVAVVFGGCDRGTARAEAEPAAAAVVADAVSAAQVSDRVDDPTFAVQMRQAGAYQAKTAGKVEVLLEAKSPYKVNQQYPIRFQLQPVAGVVFPTEVVGKDQVELKGKTALLTVAFTPQEPGVKKIGGKLKFSVCSEERCLMETRELALDVEVK